MNTMEMIDELALVEQHRNALGWLLAAHSPPCAFGYIQERLALEYALKLVNDRESRLISDINGSAT